MEGGAPYSAPLFIFLLTRYCPRIKVIIYGQNPLLVSVGFLGHMDGIVNICMAV